MGEEGQRHEYTVGQTMYLFTLQCVVVSPMHQAPLQNETNFFGNHLACAYLNR